MDRLVDQAMDNKATTQKYSLSIQGGTDKTNVYASLVYNRDQGLLSNEKLNKYSVRYIHMFLALLPSVSRWSHSVLKLFDQLMNTNYSPELINAKGRI